MQLVRRTESNTQHIVRRLRMIGSSIMAALMLSTLSHITQASTEATAPHMTVKLISNHTQISHEQIVKDDSFLVGVEFIPEKDWHIYWRNPGDTGLAPKIQWRSSPSFTFGDIQWPIPEEINVAHLTDYGMHNSTLLFSRINKTKSLDSQQTNITIHAKVNWLVCKESCIPGEADLQLSLPIGSHPIVNNVTAIQFQDAQTKIPTAMTTLSKTATIDNGVLSIDVFANTLLFNKAKTVEIFIEESNIAHNGPPLDISWRANRFHWKQKLSEYFNKAPETLHAVVVIDQQYGYALEIPFTTP